MKNIDELIAKLESYEDYDGFNDDLVVALREQRDEIARLQEANERFGIRQEWWNEKMFQLEADRVLAMLDVIEAAKVMFEAGGVSDEDCAFEAALARLEQEQSK